MPQYVVGTGPGFNPNAGAQIFQPLPILEGALNTQQSTVTSAVMQLWGNASRISTLVIQVTQASSNGVEILGSGNAKVGTGFQLQPGQSIAFSNFTGQIYADCIGTGTADVRILYTYNTTPGE